MTAFELKQQAAVYTRGGASAYHMGITIGNNPFSQKPFHQLWSNGYFAAKLAFENGTALTFGEWKYKKQKGLLYPPVHFNRFKSKPKPVFIAERTILTIKRMHNFNSRHRTVA